MSVPLTYPVIFRMELLKKSVPLPACRFGMNRAGIKLSGWRKRFRESAYGLYVPKLLPDTDESGWVHLNN